MVVNETKEGNPFPTFHLYMAEIRNIPTDRLKWLHRKTEREKLPKDYFLDPQKRLYPYRNKDGSINCYMLRSAYRLANMHNRKDIAQKALKLLKKHCGCCEGD